MGYNKADSPGFYSVPVPGTEEEGFSPVYRHPEHEQIRDADHYKDFKTSWDLFLHGMKRNPDAPCVGKRERNADGKLGKFVFKSYSEFFEKIKEVGTALVNHNLVREQKTQSAAVAKTCKLVGLFLPSCEEWLLLEQACYGYGYTLVPIYNTLGDESILHILKITELDVVFCTAETAGKLLRILGLSTDKLYLRTLVLVDVEAVPEDLASAKPSLRLMLWSEFLEKDVKLILDDLQTLKPTLFISVPRLYQRIHDKIMSGVQTKSGIIRHLFNRGLESKISRVRTQGVYTHKFYDKLIFDKVNKLLGGNIIWMFVGSSCLNAGVIDRVRAMIGKPLMWGYGLTESCAAGFVQNISDTNPLNLGGPSPGFQFRVRSIPELSYFVDRKPVRGELLIKGNNVSMGYFRMEAMTAETFRDGWLYTGDVVEVTDNGSVKVIDRIKQVFKLAQGEYVAPEYVESALNSCLCVAQSYVVGNSDESYPVAVVVPDEDALAAWKSANGMAGASLGELCKSAQLRAYVFEEVQKALASCNIKGYQRVKAVHLHDELFSVENNMLTVTFKLKRNTLRAKFEKEINEMYKKLHEAAA